MIIGRGGAGKSRLLRALSTDLEQAGATIRFLAMGIVVGQAQYENLPPDDRLVVIVDDAHERSEISTIISSIRRVRPHAKVILSLRPQGLAQLAADLRQIGLHPSEIPSWNIGDLKASEAEELARTVIGPEGSPWVVQRLSAIAPDCPLLIVVGATLISRGVLDATRLESSDSIRSEIMDRFGEFLVPNATNGDSALQRETLKCVAALQPFRIDDPSFRQAISTLTERAFDQVIPFLNRLERSGVLLRRGTSYRIVPDLLGDTILSDAAIDWQSGTSTGYLERVYQATARQPLQNLFVNASRVDWQIRQDRRDAADLAGPVWAALVQEFQTSGIVGRLDIIKILEKVAFFQPSRALALVRWAIANQTNAAETIDHPLAALYSPTYSEVIRELPKVVESVAFNLDYLPEAADILWQLARSDDRRLNQYPHHPIRVLAELAAYGPAKPAIFQKILIDAAERWLRRTDLAEWPYSPFEVLKPLLATEVEIRHSDGLSITLRALPVAAGAVKELRMHVLNLAFAEMQSTDLKRAVEAMRTIEASIRYPIGMFNRSVTAEERDSWTPLFVETIDQLGRTAQEVDIDPTVVIAVDRALHWHAHYSSTDTHIAAQEALARLYDSPSRKLARVLHDGWAHTVAYSGDIEDSERRRQAYLDQVVAEVTQSWPDNELVDNIGKYLTANRTAHGEDSGQPGPFVWTLVRARPVIGEIICHRIISEPTCILRELLSIVLPILLESDSTTALRYARILMKLDDVIVQRYVAHAFGRGRGTRTVIADGEAEFLKALISNRDATVRQLAVAAAHALSASQGQLAKELATTVRFDDSAEVAEEVAVTFSRDRLSWGELSTLQRNRLIAQLRECPSIDGYHLGQLISTISGSDPEVVLRLLKGRIERYEESPAGGDYHPLPHNWHTALQFRNSPLFVESLREVIFWMAEDVDSWIRQSEGSELFSVVAAGFDEQVLGVITEAIDSGDIKQIQAAGHVLRKAPRNLAWENVDFVTHALEAADRNGSDCFRSVAGGLHASVITGMRHGTPGQPYQEDIEERDKSAEVAAHLPFGSIGRQFYEALHDSAQQRIKSTERSDRISPDGRDW